MKPLRNGLWFEAERDSNPIRFRWRMRWWRVKTWLRLLPVGERVQWRRRFLTEPCLFSARYNGCYQTMAGFYNDTVPDGFMTEAQARKILRGADFGNPQGYVMPVYAQPPM